MICLTFQGRFDILLGKRPSGVAGLKYIIVYGKSQIKIDAAQSSTTEYFMYVEIMNEEANADNCWERIIVAYDGESDTISIRDDIEDGNIVWEGDGPNSEWGGSARLSAEDYLAVVAYCQSRERHFTSVLDELVERSPEKDWERAYYSATGCLTVSDEVWDRSYLDSFNIIEQGYKRKKEARDIRLSLVEEVMLNKVATAPEVIHGFDPRTFEVFVAQLLSTIGFSSVKLQRFWQDQGRDIIAVYVEGDREEVVVVEVKHRSHSSGVGIEIVDRLNGVRDRDGFSKGLVVTNSHFSGPAKRYYSARRDHIALVDFERLVEFLGEKGGWSRSPGGLWTPAHHLS